MLALLKESNGVLGPFDCATECLEWALEDAAGVLTSDNSDLTSISEALSFILFVFYLIMLSVMLKILGYILYNWVL